MEFKDLPKNDSQKFQIGEICKIVRLGNLGFTHPKPTDLETMLKDRECIILYTYSQVYWGNDYSRYCVYLLPRKEEYFGSLAWIDEIQFDYIREPTKKEIDIILNEDNRCLAWGESHPYKGIFKKKVVDTH